MEITVQNQPGHPQQQQQQQQHYDGRHPQRSSSTMKSRKVIGKYFLSKTLGKGSMGKVKLALNTETNQKMAVKIVPRRTTQHHSTPPTQKERKAEISREIRTIREASIMLLLDHPYIARLEEMVLVDNFYFLFMEYVDGGQLLDYIIAHGKLKERQARHFSRQIASALDYCHRNSIVHRDLKVENILISRSGNIKIIDFGLSNVFSPRSHLSTFCGSLYFAAPELLDGRIYTGPEVDVWSFGVVLYVLVCGQVPFDDPTMAGMHAKVKGGQVEYPSHLSSDCKNMLQRMLVTQQERRATMSELIVHPWMNKGYNTPVENYLPKRKPLQLPIDMNVVHGMRGFEFGSEEVIKEELEHLISSREYQTSARELELSSSALVDMAPSSNLLRRKSFSQPSNDPQTIPAAYHPLISIYYLVQERMKRDQANKKTPMYQPINDHLVSQVEDVQQHDTIGVSYSAHGKTEVHNPTAQEEEIIRNALDVAQITSPRASLDFGKGHRRKMSDTSATSTFSSSNDNSKPSLFRRFNRRLSRQMSSENNGNTIAPIANARQNRQDQEVPIIVTEHKSDIAAPILTINGSPVDEYEAADAGMGKKINRFLKRATSITVKDLPSQSHHSSHERQLHDRRASACTQAHERVSTIERSSSTPADHDEVRRRRMQQERVAGSPDSLLALPTSDPVLEVQEDEDVRSTQHQHKADETVRSVYLKGLFSVSTTSNKKPSAIRQEILRVLQKKNIRYRERNDRFECLLSSKGYDLHEYAEDEDTSSKDPRAVRFDIHIVKIPMLLGMRGVRFRRVSGDSWHYKNICSTILDSLRL